MNKIYGFSLIEAMIALVILATTLTFAVPTFVDTIRNNRMTAQANEFLQALVLTRSEALKRNTTITVCRAMDVSAGCGTGAGWEAGWLVFADPVNQGTCQDTDNSGSCDDGEVGMPNPKPILLFHETLGGALTLRGNNPAVNRITYRATGIFNGLGASLFLCDERGIQEGRRIAISAAGRAQIRDPDPGDACIPP